MAFEKIKKLLHRHRLTDIARYPGIKICYLCGEYVTFADGEIKRALNRDRAWVMLARLTDSEYAVTIQSRVQAEQNNYGVGYEIALMHRAYTLLLEGLDRSEVEEIVCMEKYMGIGYVDYLKEAGLWRIKDEFQQLHRM